MADLFDSQFREKLVDFIDRETPRLETNAELFAILENQMYFLLKKKLVEDLGPKSAAAAMERMAPINYYRKVIDKLTTIYQQGVVRKVVGGTDSDQDLVDWYVDQLNLNPKMNVNNEAYNAYQYSLLQLTLKEPDPITQIRKPFIRTIPNHEYLIYNDDSVDPTTPDVIIVLAGSMYDQLTGVKKQLYHVYSNTQFIVMDGSGDIVESEMMRLDQDGNNEFMSYPFIYANSSENLAMPLVQYDDRQIALLIPILLTDLNYANKFQAFSLFYGIDVDDANLEISPNSWINLKSDPQGTSPSFGTIKPTVDSDKTLASSSSQISLWLSSKGIRPGTVGSLDGDAFASGISKLIDESDTFEARKRQIDEYKTVETQFWDKLLKVYHPRWVAMGLIENRTLFSPSASVVTVFQTPKPLQTRAEMVREVREELDAGFITKRMALRMVNPDLDEDEIDGLMEAIETEDVSNIVEMEGVDDGEEQDADEDPARSA